MDEQNWVSGRISVLGEVCGLLWGTSLFGGSLTGSLTSEILGNLSHAELCSLFTAWRDSTFSQTMNVDRPTSGFQVDTGWDSRHSLLGSEFGETVWDDRPIKNQNLRSSRENHYLQHALLEVLLNAITVTTHTHLSKVGPSQQKQIHAWLKRRIAAAKDEMRLGGIDKSWGQIASEDEILSAGPEKLAELNLRACSQQLRDLKQKIESALYVNTLPALFRDNFEQDWLPCVSLHLAVTISTDVRVAEFLQKSTQNFALGQPYRVQEMLADVRGVVLQLTELLSNPQTCLSLVQIVDFDVKFLRQEIQTIAGQQLKSALFRDEGTILTRSDSWLAPKDAKVDQVLELLDRRPLSDSSNITTNQVSPAPISIPKISETHQVSSAPELAPKIPETPAKSIPKPPPPPPFVVSGPRVNSTDKPTGEGSGSKKVGGNGPKPGTAAISGPRQIWKCIHTLTGHSDSVVSVAYGGVAVSNPARSKGSSSVGSGTGEMEKNSLGGSDKPTLASGSWDKTIKIWAFDPELRSPLPIRTLTAHSASVYSVAFSADGQMLASGGVDYTIQLWHVGNSDRTESGASPLRTLTGHSFPVYSVAFSPDGKLLASGSGDYTIKIWHLPSGKLLSTLIGHSSFVYSVAFSPDGQTIASGSADKTIKIWQVSTGQLLRTLIGHAPVNSVAFSPDHRFLVSGSRDETIKLWQLGTGALGAGTRPAPTLTFTGHRAEVFSVAISPKEPILASGSHDKTIKLWQLETGTPICTLTGHLDSVNCVAFSRDGHMLASASHDKTIKLWRRIQ